MSLYGAFKSYNQKWWGQISELGHSVCSPVWGKVFLVEEYFFSKVLWAENLFIGKSFGEVNCFFEVWVLDLSFLVMLFLCGGGGRGWMIDIYSVGQFKLDKKGVKLASQIFENVWPDPLPNSKSLTLEMDASPLLNQHDDLFDWHVYLFLRSKA